MLRLVVNKLIYVREKLKMPVGKKPVHLRHDLLKLGTFIAVTLVLFIAAPAAIAKDDVNADVEARVKSILESMTLEQKVGQMVQGEIKSVTPADVTKYHLGSILNGGGSFPNGNKNAEVSDWLALADQYYHASMDTTKGGAGIPILWGTDAVHGHNNVIGATLFPHNIGLGAANDPKLMQKIGEITAREVAVTGIDWLFAPTVAVVKDNRWGRTYEGYSSESPIVKSYAGEVVLGVQGVSGELRTNHQRVIATAKHFIGDGGTFRGIDQGDTRLDLDTLIEEHGQGYITALDADVQTVMASFNRWNGLKIHGHKQLLTDVLKDQMNFDGFVVSDWDGIGQVDGCNNETCPQAINAGIDMVMVPHDWKELLQNTLLQVRSGEIPIARIDDAVSRILRVKLRAGLFEKGAPSSREVAGNEALIGSPEHRAVAREAVRKSLVLLKNNKRTLPLKSGQHILVTGDGADNIGKQNGGWTITWQGTENENSNFPGATSIYAGIEQAMADIGGSTELSVDDSWTKKPDVAVVVFGEEPYAEGQGDVDTLLYRNGLKTDLELLQKLKSKNIPVVAVFLTGRPLWINAELNSSDAFVVAWLPGTEGGGVADVLVADKKDRPRYNFTGRLSFDWPNAELNAEDRSQPVASLLLKRGQGLSYGESNIVSNKLNEVAMVSKSTSERVLFSGSPKAPWSVFVGDSSNWSKKVVGTETNSAFGALSVKTVDGNVQEDSRAVEWTGGYMSQFFFQSESPLDLSGLAEDGGALSMTFKVDKNPEGQVIQRMDCGYPCSGGLDLTRLFSVLPEGKWVTASLKLSCFGDNGVDLSRVNAPLLISTDKPFGLTIIDVRLTADVAKNTIVGCP
jgi:beta-glucosidase